ncbi:hypothetical protein H8356DRAFT_1738833 [Neocallimastix lanati (nom. inval.)]|uniref:GSKIP domain-containing protein n=1 Tax=Neocallimastix californiae TaxID=1754190 RepID=A0A1Y2CG54_9FUNG|nr:hypothetical protein H8356DRAFT_1738833 [Neocallimastix sp. JGI-2020a]ORY45804.1 hypothetical protein LY90DRAFT_671465 [Neocallimastix californiae]|eukprot:ORY45804.1 hypothetical protein LY90DRAFT_671465 [Neocallimastix californiae]
MRQEAVYEELEYLGKIRYGLKPNSEIYIKKNANNEILNYIADTTHMGVMDVDITTSLLKDNSNFVTLKELDQVKSKITNEEVNFVIFKCCLIENVWIVVKLSDSGYTVIDTFSEKPTFENLNDFNFSFGQNREAEEALYPYINFSFETMENLLHTVSPSFRGEFKDSLINKLQLELEKYNEEGN